MKRCKFVSIGLIVALMLFAVGCAGTPEEQKPEPEKPSASTYTVAVDTCEGGTVAVDVKKAEAGATVTVTATPATGYRTAALWYRVGEALTAITGTTFTMPASDVTVGGTFEKIEYTVTVGTVEHGTVTTDVNKATYGQTVTVTAKGDVGYIPDKSSLGYTVGGVFTQITDGAFVMPAGNVTVSAQYRFVGSIATDFIGAFHRDIDVWEYLPAAFKPENRAVAVAPSGDYTDFVSIADVPKNGIGSQMDVVIGLLQKAQAAIAVTDTVFDAGTAIAEVYQTYINGNPDGYASFSGEAAGFRFKIDLTADNYTLLAGRTNLCVELRLDRKTGVQRTRVQLSDSNAVLVETSENALTVACSIVGVSRTQVDFVRNGSGSVGHMYETLGWGDKDLKISSALIEVTPTYTTVAGNKGQFYFGSTGRNVEVYDSKTGNLAGTEVKETTTVSGISVTFNTLWYTLDDIGGLTSIKRAQTTTTDKDGKEKTETHVYVNGSANAFENANFGGFTPKTASRMYDIEWKPMTFYVTKTTDDGKTEYEKVTVDVPMFFVQEEKFGEFGQKAYDTNKKNGITAALTVRASAADRDAVKAGYTTQLEAYEEIRDSISGDQITAAIGEKDPFFAAEAAA